ncbi:cytochrome b/b6 domain-containing protein [Chitinibacter sp. SCUT-21]|uniref:cytochrome b/b6 domain-containing protein n=1 Tax=Chitinibacter sp. SCUT-21 TaxID=2970891 RepID=UPI0035A5C637
MNQSATQCYHPLSLAGHWLAAALAVLCMLTVLLASILGRRHPAHDVLMLTHMWSGQGLFLVNLLRLLVLSTFGQPAPAGLNEDQKMGSAVLHALLYGLVGFLACSSALMLLAQAAGQQWLGMTIPLLLTGGAVMLVAQCHQLAGILLVFVTLAHIAMAYALHVKGEESVLSRMTPKGRALDYLTSQQGEDNYARIDRHPTPPLS